MVFLVLARILAMVGKIWPCVTRMMVTAVESNSLPVAASAVATNCCCCGLAWLLRLMPSSGAILRHISSRPACPTTRCLPASFISGVVPRSMAISPSGYSHSPAARTLMTKSRSASVRGPYWVLAMIRSGVATVFSTPTKAG